MSLIINQVRSFLLVFTISIVYLPVSNARLFGPNNYEECIDGVVKFAKTESATELGRDNCYNKFIGSEFNKRYKKAEENRYRKATKSEIALLRCERKHIENTSVVYVECIIPDQMSKIYKLKMIAEFEDGSTSEVELQNWIKRDPTLHTFNWGKSATTNANDSIFTKKIRSFRKETLQIMPNEQ